jgi:hypothetical protein
MPNWALLLIRVVLSSAFSALITWIGWKLGQRSWALVAFLVSVPVVGFAIARPLIELSHEGLTWLRHSPLHEWEGSYYEFAGVHVRVYELDGRLWFGAPDVIKALGLQASPALMLSQNLRGCRKLSGTGIACLTVEAAEKLVLDHAAPEGARFVNWMRREVVTPWERKRSGALAAR